MPRIIEKTVYTFDELSDKAKDRARDWWRESDHDYEWWDNVYEDFFVTLPILGFDVSRRNGKHYDISFQLHVQGEGVGFDAYWEFKPDCVEKIKEHAPQDSDLLAMAEELVSIFRRTGPHVRGHIKQGSRGAYIEDVYFEHVEDSYWDCHDDVIDDFKKLVKGLARWMLKQLDDEWRYRNSDEYVDECIIGNDYEFDEDGRLV